MINASVVEGLVNSCLKKGFDGAAPVPDCHREWWELCCSQYPFVALAAPRGHAKSTAITHSYTAAKILFRESKFVLIVSDTESQAVLFVTDLKKELVENEDLVKMFGIKGLLKDADSDFIIQFDDGETARVMAKGSGQSLRGVKWDRKRPDLIICDDLENDEIVLNKERREKFRRWFSATLIPCRSKTGIIRVIGTIIHTDSMLARLMPKEHKKDVVVEPLKVYYKPNARANWKAILYRAHDSKMTQCLWPEYKGIDWLKQERQSYIDQGIQDIWSQEYLNNPLDEERAPFRRSDFVTMKPEDEKQNFNFYVAGDFALSTKERADYTTFVVGAVDEQGKLYIVHVIRERMQSDEIEDTIFELNRVYHPELFFFEKGQAWLAVQPHVMESMVIKDQYFSYEEFPSVTDKLTRASAIRARMRAGAVKFKKDTEWWGDFEDELLKFPRGEHDDQVDSLSLLGRGLMKFVSAPTKEDIDEDEREDRLRESEIIHQGMSEICGY